jgi:hypothetical protein
MITFRHQLPYACLGQREQQFHPHALQSKPCRRIRLTVVTKHTNHLRFIRAAQTGKLVFANIETALHTTTTICEVQILKPDIVVLHIKTTTIWPKGAFDEGSALAIDIVVGDAPKT